jgi:pimeloyl-ACP methyl ester carboxylesterase
VPRIKINNVELQYELRGGGPATIVFAHGVLLSGRMFEPQLDRLSRRYRCLAYDSRSHGGSQITREGLDLDTLAADAAALIEQLDAAPCHFVGLSLGSFVGLRLALRRPELLRSLTLLGSSADPEPNYWRFRLMTQVARWLSPRLVMGALHRRVFGERFRRDPARAKEAAFWRQQMLANDVPAMTRCVVEVLSRRGVYDEIGRIAVPTLIVVGEEDRVTPPEHSRRLHERIAGSKLVVIPRNGHVLSVEAPGEVSEAIEAFLAALPAGVSSPL